MMSFSLRMNELNETVTRLLLIRGLRSVGQGAMVVDLTLYLKSLHWSGAAIGGVTSASGLVGAGLILLVGILSDRVGRKPFLLFYEAATLLFAMLACVTTVAWFLVLAIVITGFGHGQSGAAGPFGPAEQAWLARHVPRERRGQVFSLNNAIGFAGMAVGAVFAGVPTLMTQWYPGTTPLAAYRPVFALVAVFSAVCTGTLMRMVEVSAQAVAGERARSVATAETPGLANPEPIIPEAASPSERLIRRQENIALSKLAFVTVLNGLAIGFTGPMMAYWFSLRFGANTAEIGVTLAISFLATGILSLVSGALAGRYGMVKSVTWMRVGGSLLMLILPWMPTFGAASVIYVLRNAVNRGTQGNRSALSTSLTRDHRRGLAASINALSMRLPSSIGPAVTGGLFEAGNLSLPIYLTAGLQLVYAALYQWMFGRVDTGSSNKKD